VPHESNPFEAAGWLLGGHGSQVGPGLLLRAAKFWGSVRCGSFSLGKCTVMQKRIGKTSGLVRGNGVFWFRILGYGLYFSKIPGKRLKVLLRNQQLTNE
jgi:hypothetical protein